MDEAEDLEITLGPETENHVVPWLSNPAEICRHPISTILDVVDADFCLAHAPPAHIGLTRVVRQVSKCRKDQRRIAVPSHCTETALTPIQNLSKLRLSAR